MLYESSKEMVGDVVTFADAYLGKKIYALSKADDGLDKKRLARLHGLLMYASHVMDDARVAHVKIESPAKRMSDIGRFLRDFSKQRMLDGRRAVPLYALKYEVGIKNKREHAHLYVIADGWSTQDFKELVVQLERKGFSEGSREEIKKPIQLVARRGDYVPDNGSQSYHKLTNEFDDAFERISYLAKIKTTSGLRRKPFSASRIPIEYQESNYLL